MQFNIVRHNDTATISAVANGRLLVADHTHPNFKNIADALLAGDVSEDQVEELFDTQVALARSFEAVSERVSISDGVIYFDGDPVDNSLTQAALRAQSKGDIHAFHNLVDFYENVAQNPNDHSREQLYDWLRDRDFQITAGGHFVAYKGVTKDNQGNYVSVNRGRAIVDGQEVRGAIPNAVGNVVEMPRSEVQHNPGIGCSTGLHAGTREYAEGWAREALLRVRINPRDVVSVPVDCDAQKIRVSKYQVLEVVPQDDNDVFEDDAPDSEVDLDEYFEDTEDEDLAWGEEDEDETDPEGSWAGRALRWLR